MAHKDHHLRRNFWMHCLEGGAYMAGLAFISPETVLPSFVKTLGGSVNLIALMPVLLPASFSILGLFVAPLVERMHHLKPFVVLFGAVQRLPYLIAALLMFWLPHSREVLLPIVVLTPIISGLIGGVGVNAWMEMVTRMIPENLRASGWAIRYVIQGVIGLAAGPVIHWLLSRHADVTGYAWLHLICFAFLTLSFCAQCFMREESDHAPLRLPRPSYKSYLHQLPVMLTEHPRLIRLIFARFTGLGWLLLVSFLTIHALKATGRPEADVGHLVLASMLGSLAGNIFAGWIGNRSGGRALMLFSRSLCLLLCAALPFIHSFPGFLAVLFILGFGLFVDRVGDLTFSAELCPRERRPTYQAILSFCQAVALLLAASLSGLTFYLTQNFLGVVALSAVFAAASLLILRGIPEVRGRGTKGHASPVMGENTPLV